MSALAKAKDLLYGAFDPQAYGYKHTPDVKELEKKVAHLMFFPCDMQKGKPNSWCLDEAYHYAPAYTKERFHFYRKNLGNESFPIPLRSEKKPDPIPKIIHVAEPPLARIRGSLLWVPTKTIIEDLDKYRQNTVEFRRERIQVIIPYKEMLAQRNRDDGTPLLFLTNEQVKVEHALAYVGINSYWEEYLDAGALFSPVKTQISRAKKWLKGEEFYEF